ncbi:MAG: hypothetical protein AAFV95_27545 [Bacteroidota bacterium]
MRKSRFILFGLTSIFFLSGLFSSPLLAQCGKFTDSPKESEGLEAHVLYRDQVKAKNFDAAFDQWQIAYAIAPAADGKRPFHYTDGRAIYMHKFKNSSDDAAKKEFAEMILKLYDEQINCYGKDGEEARLLGRKAFDMFYTLRTSYSVISTTLQSAVDKGGNDTEYITFVPYATVVEYLFTNDKMEKAKARGIYTTLNEIADYNIEKNEKYKAQYQQAKDAMNGIFARIEASIFDCPYFVKKLTPEFETKSEDPAFLEESIRILKKRGCEDTEPLLVQLEGKWSKYAAIENAKRQAEFEANNPGVAAKKLYDSGDFKGAIGKYKEAIDKEEDPSKQAGYWFSIASIQFRKLKTYGAARASARKAAELRSGWGRPYMLIGDMYGTSARSCGDSWNQRLAILAAIDKYRYAKSIDSEVAAEANTRISKYTSAKPEQEEGFMRGVKAGQKVTCGCWIAEKVTVSFK